MTSTTPPPRPIVPLVDPPDSHAFAPIAGARDVPGVPCGVCGFPRAHHTRADADPLPVFGPPAHVPEVRPVNRESGWGDALPLVVTTAGSAYLAGYNAGLRRAHELLTGLVAELRVGELEAMAAAWTGETFADHEPQPWEPTGDPHAGADHEGVL